MKNSFENSIKNKVEQFDEMPPDHLWGGISRKINSKMENKINNNYSKLWMGIAASLVIVLAAIAWNSNSTEHIESNSDSQLAIAQQVTAGGKGETTIDLFPTELELARQQGKGIMAYVCMENCKFCKKFVDETLSLPAVHEYLEERFIQVAVDLRDDKNAPFFKKYGINAAPSAVFFDANGGYLDMSKGACATEVFMEIAEGAWQEVEEGSDVNTAENILLKAKIFPNPSNGNLNIQLNGAEGALLIKVFNEKGAEVFQEKKNDFSGYLKEAINLTDLPKGMYYLKAIQKDQVSTEKIIIQ